METDYSECMHFLQKINGSWCIGVCQELWVRQEQGNRKERDRCIVTCQRTCLSKIELTFFQEMIKQIPAFIRFELTNVMATRLLSEHYLHSSMRCPVQREKSSYNPPSHPLCTLPRRYEVPSAEREEFLQSPFLPTIYHSQEISGAQCRERSSYNPPSHPLCTLPRSLNPLSPNS